MTWVTGTLFAEGIENWWSFLLAPATLASFCCFYLYKYRQYRKGAYYQITKAPYLFLNHNLGRYGEYLIYKHLRHIESAGGKFLFNLYIPKNQEQKTEIDVLLICSEGLFVFESKNFGGWIFGNEAHQDWTQVFPKGYGRSHKEKFYNPVKQNARHIRYLKVIVGENIPTHSVIVFSDRCTLKDVTVSRSNATITYLSDVASSVDRICNEVGDTVLTEIEIAKVYDKLWKYTQISEEDAELHIRDIQGI